MDTGALSLAHYRLELGTSPPHSPIPFPSPPLHRPLVHIGLPLPILFKSFCLIAGASVLFLIPQPSAIVTLPHSLTICINNPNSAPLSVPTHSFDYHSHPLTYPRPRRHRVWIFPFLLGSVGRAIPLPSSVLFPSPARFLRTAAALYLNEQSTTVIVARQGFSLVSFT